MINRVVLVGRLTRDPELKNVSGKPLGNFSLAVDNRIKNPDGSRSASFFNCVCFNVTAENVCKLARKGMLVGIEGRLQQRSYVKKDGTKASTVEILVDSFTFLEPKGDNPNNRDNDVTFDDEIKDDNGNVDGLEIPDEDLPF